MYTLHTLQIEHASKCSHEAKLVKLADKLYNLRDLEVGVVPKIYKKKSLKIVLCLLIVFNRGALPSVGRKQGWMSTRDSTIIIESRLE